MSVNDVNDFLMGQGIKAAKFDNLGDTVMGTITDLKKEQARKFGPDGKPTNELDFWPSGDPIWNIVATLQTDERDPANAEDNGTRRLFITPRMQNSVRDALKAISAPGLEIGGRIAVRWTEGTGRTGSPRGYMAQYVRPVITVGTDSPDLFSDTAPAAQAAPVATLAPAGQSDLFTAPAGPAKPANVPADVWDRLDPVQRQAVSAAAGGPGF